jgi:integrase/recombinase XerD
MTSLKAHLEEYLKLRRQLGFQLVVEGHLLKQFVRFASEEGTARITINLVLRWVTKVPVIQCSLRAKRLSAVRQFAQYLSSVDPSTEVPPRRLLPDQSRRPAPHLFQDEQVVALIEAAQQVKSRQGLKGATLATLFGLLAVTGMRVGEAIRLDRDDVDFGQALVRVRQSKGNKERLVLLHTSTQKALRGYVALRNRVCPHPSCSRFFLFEGGTRLFHCTINRWFLRLCGQIGMRCPGDRRGPRLHGLRHRFAIQTLLRWYASNADVEAHLPELATFLGHADVSGTYWYLSATPELLQLATERLAHIKGEYYK